MKKPVCSDPRSVEKIYLLLNNGRAMEVCNLIKEAGRFSNESWYDVQDYLALHTMDNARARTDEIREKAEFNGEFRHLMEEQTEKVNQARARSGHSRPDLSGIRNNRAEDRDMIREQSAWNLGEAGKKVLEFQPQAIEPSDEDAPPRPNSADKFRRITSNLIKEANE